MIKEGMFRISFEAHANAHESHREDELGTEWLGTPCDDVSHKVSKTRLTMVRIRPKPRRDSDPNQPSLIEPSPERDMSKIKPSVRI